MFGAGSMLAALALPRLLESLHDRLVMFAGAFGLVSGLLVSATVSFWGLPGWGLFHTIWFVLGLSYSAVLTPSGRLVRRCPAQAGTSEFEERSLSMHTTARKAGFMSYWRFAAMIVTSTIIMYGLMYLNSWELSHMWFSQTRLWMALYMGGVMAIIMLAFMLGMYTNARANLAIFAGAAVLFAVSLYLVRSQATIGDTAWMKAMIPHHSIAVLTSSRANIKDPRVRHLADEIIKAQKLEIAEMEALIADLNGGPKATPEIDGK